jgi:PPOX class probable F420-dependent enzyme
MSDSRAATDRGHQVAADGGFFARLASAKYALLATFKPDGTVVSAAVQAVVDGDRAYFRAWSQSGMVKRLRYTDAVQVTPCTARGLVTYGPPLDATARLLSGEEASRVAMKLARRYPARRGSLISLLRRRLRWQLVYYELLAYDATGDTGMGLEELPHVFDRFWRGRQAS